MKNTKQNFDKFLGVRLDAADMKNLSRMATKARISKSRFCRELIRERAAKESSNG